MPYFMAGCRKLTSEFESVNRSESNVIPLFRDRSRKSDNRSEDDPGPNCGLIPERTKVTNIETNNSLKQGLVPPSIRIAEDEMHRLSALQQLVHAALSARRSISVPGNGTRNGSG